MRRRAGTACGCRWCPAGSRGGHGALGLGSCRCLQRLTYYLGHVSSLSQPTPTRTDTAEIPAVRAARRPSASLGLPVSACGPPPWQRSDLSAPLPSRPGTAPVPARLPPYFGTGNPEPPRLLGCPSRWRGSGPPAPFHIRTSVAPDGRALQRLAWAREGKALK